MRGRSSNARTDIISGCLLRIFCALQQIIANISLICVIIQGIRRGLLVFVSAR